MIGRKDRAARSLPRPTLLGNEQRLTAPHCQAASHTSQEERPQSALAHRVDRDKIRVFAAFGIPTEWGGPAPPDRTAVSASKPRALAVSNASTVTTSEVLSNLEAGSLPNAASAAPNTGVRDVWLGGGRESLA